MISKTPRRMKPVAPAQAGAQTLPHWIPACAGMTRFWWPLVSHQARARRQSKPPAAMMPRAPQAGLTLPAVAGRGSSEGFKAFGTDLAVPSLGMKLEPQSANNLEYRVEAGATITGKRLVQALARQPGIAGNL